MGGAAALLEMQLAEFAEAGLLTSEDDLRSEVWQQASHTPADPVTITAVGIPTRDRPSCLRRALASYVGNTARYGRTPEFIVVDDSRSPSMQRRNQEVVYDLQDQCQGNLRYLGLGQREEYARRLACVAGVPLETVRFAILGDEECSVTHGAVRNMLLLHTAGEVTLQVDDDTVCEVAASPVRREGLNMTSQHGVHEFWFYPDHEAARQAVSFEDHDFCSIHERLLGHTLSGRLGEARQQKEEIGVDDMSSRFLDNMQKDEARIVASFAGVLGDTGGGSNWHMLFMEDDSFMRLTGSKADYRAGLRTRQMLKAPLQQHISDGKYCMAGNIGLDNRRLLPPFVPVQRNEDGVFGHILHTCFPNAFSGHLPYVIVHDPPERRPVPDDAMSIGVTSLRTNDIMIYLIALFTVPRRQQDAPTVEALGRFLEDLSAQPEAAFREAVRAAVTQAVSKRIRYAEHRLHERKEQPTYWAADMHEHIRRSQQSVLQEEFFVPCDLAGNTEGRRRHFQRIVGSYGQLLRFWPALIDAAKALN